MNCVTVGQKPVIYSKKMLNTNYVKSNSSVKTTIDCNSRNRHILKIISYFFLISQVVIGVDFGFSKLLSENGRRFLRIFNTLEICTYNIIFCSPIIIQSYPFTSIVPLILMPFSEYVLNASILLWYKKYSVYDYLCNISEFCKLTKNDTYILSLMSIINFIATFCLRIYFVIMITVYDLKVEYYFDQLSFVYRLFFCLYYVVMDLVTITQIVIFYYVYSSMKNMKHMLMSPGQKLSFISLRYKAIVDIYEKIRPLSDSLVSETNFFTL